MMRRLSVIILLVSFALQSLAAGSISGVMPGVTLGIVPEVGTSDDVNDAKSLGYQTELAVSQWSNTLPYDAPQGLEGYDGGDVDTSHVTPATLTGGSTSDAISTIPTGLYLNDQTYAHAIRAPPYTL
jgi:hypothetical protein